MGCTTVYEQIDPSITTEFVGYENLTYASKVTVMTTETEIVEALSLLLDINYEVKCSCCKFGFDH